MNIRQSFQIAIQAIWSKKVRSALTMLGVIIGIFAVIVMVSIVQGSTREMKEYYESLGTNRVNIYAYSNNNKKLYEELYDYCMEMDDLVLGITPVMNCYSESGIKYQAISTANMERGTPQIYLGSEQYSICNNFTIEKGRDISWLDVQKYEQVIVLGARVAEYLFPYRDPIGETVSINGVRFTVIGVYAAKDPKSEWSMDNMAVVPYSLNRLLMKDMEMSEFCVKASSKEATTEVITRLDSFLAARVDEKYGGYSVYSENQWIDQDQQVMKMLSLVVGGIAGISLLVGGIGIMNIMLVTVKERTREIGIRMAIGASRATIILQFLIEASVICAIGGIVGLLLGSLGTLVAGKLIMDDVLLPSLGMALGAVAFSVFLGVGFGMYPAVKASGLQPVDALRNE